MSQENEEVKKESTGTPVSETTQPTSGSMFGVTKETKEKNTVPLRVATKLAVPNPVFPHGYEFPKATLVNVIADPKYNTKNGDTAVLQFVFKDSNGGKHIHFEWKQDPTDAKFKEKMEGLNVRVKHIYTAVFGDFPDEGIGTTAQSFEEYFQMIADAFNNKTSEDGKKIYSTRNLYYKLVYYKGNLGFPLSPNFVEMVRADRPCNLTINLKYDTLESKVVAGGTNIFAGMSGGADIPNDLPSFDEGFE